MLNLSLMSEAAALAGYTITSGTGQDAINKLRAQRRVNLIKADIISRYGGKWDANYREGWLPLVPLYNTGTANFTNASRTVIGTGTAWTTAMKGQKILAPDNTQYKIASVTNSTTLVLSQPYQGTSVTLNAYQIWKDEYRLFPDALSVGGFINYTLPAIMTESWPRNQKTSFPSPTSTDTTRGYTVIGREPLTSSYSTGTVTGSINTTTLTGIGTSWLDNVEPGFELTIGANKYHVKKVNSDTEIELYQQLVIAVSTASYSTVGKNSIIIRFNKPASAQVVSYWYWAKDYPFMNDNDEDWVAEMFPKVIINGMTYYDYIDKNDPVRADRASIAYQNSIEDMKVATDSAMTGVRTLGYDIPPEARD